jgi:periplasmic protein CpxP/Spy
MDTRARNKNLIFIIIFLIFTNLIVVGYFLFSHKEHGYGGRLDKDGFIVALRKEVGFKDEQVNKFRQLKQTNWAEAKGKMDQIRELKSKLFDLTKQSNLSDSAINILADSIGSLQKQVEINSFHHFKATRDICTPQQQPLYDSLMKKIINRQGKGPRPEDRR